MTELQKVFLFYTFIYFLIKGAVIVVFYFSTIVAEKLARQRHEQLEMLYKKRRADEKERWKVAYSFYDRRKFAE